MYNTRVCKVVHNLFQAIRSGSQDDDDDDDDDNDYIIYRSQSNSVILSAQIPNVDVSNLANPIEMRFQQNIKVRHTVVSDDDNSTMHIGISLFGIFCQVIKRAGWSPPLIDFRYIQFL